MITLREILETQFLAGGFSSIAGTPSLMPVTCRQLLKYKVAWHSVYIFYHRVVRYLDET